MAVELAHQLARSLHGAGVDRIFGVPGGGPNLDMIGAAQELGIDFVLCHGETAACIMAGAYGRMTGSSGAAIVTRGPGLTSAVNGLAQATLDRFPLVLVSDAVPQETAHRVSHQRLDQLATTRPVSKWSGTLGTGSPETLVSAAAELAMTGPAGGVHLNFDPSAPGDRPPERAISPASSAVELHEAANLLAGAHHPVIIAGLDAARHPETIREALAELSCPVLATYQAKGVIPESWPTYAGFFTGATMERPLLEQADAIVAVGVDPVEPMPGPWPYDAPLVMVHSHPVDGSYFGHPPVLVGSYEKLLRPLLDGLAPAWEHGAGRRIHRANLERLSVATGGLAPHALVKTTRAVMGDGPVTVDAGAHMLVTMPLWATDRAGEVLISNGLATMGYALPAAIGAALARPGERVICFVGDGGLGMTLSELETLCRLHLPVTVVVFNDASLTLIELKQRTGHGGQGAVRYGLTNFAAVAEALGMPGHIVTDEATLEKVLEQMSDGPELIDARIEAAPYWDVIRATRG